MELTQDQIRGTGKNKRMWSDEEDMKLIEALLNLHNTRLYNADRGFKPGHIIAVEKILAVTLPNSSLKADPHIKSRMKTLKTHFDVVHDMLHGPNTSGFGYDDMKQCVVAEKPVWDAYLQSHKNAAKFKDRPFLYYKELCTIFGKDRATGNDAETAADVVDKLDKEQMDKGKENENDDVEDGLDEIDALMSFIQSPMIEKTGDMSSKNKRKRKFQSVTESLCEVVKQSSSLIASDIKSSTERLSQAIEDASANELKIRLNEELKRLPGFNITKRSKALVQIGRDRDLIQIFFTLDEDEKEELVKTVIS